MKKCTGKITVICTIQNFLNSVYIHLHVMGCYGYIKMDLKKKRIYISYSQLPSSASQSEWHKNIWCAIKKISKNSKHRDPIKH